MKFPYKLYVVFFSIIILSCCSSNNNTESSLILQNINIQSSDIFPQGGEFTLSKNNDKCILQGTGYSDYGYIEYKISFYRKKLYEAIIVNNKYKDPLFVNPDANVISEVTKDLNSDKDYIYSSFDGLKVIISEENKNKCGLDFSAQNKITDKKWLGHYNYSTYVTAENGVGYGAEYDINIKIDSCTIDIVGYQVDKHFNCYVEPVEGKNSITLYDAQKNKSFGTINHHEDGRYTIDMSYYLEDNNDSYDVNKVK